MKVMQLLPELNSGGVERGTLEIARALVAQGHQSLVVSNGGRLVSQLEAEGSTHLTLPIHKKSLSSLWQIRPLRQLIEEHQPDIVHVRSRVPAWLTHFALRKIPANKRPHLISTVHGFYSVNRYSAIMTQAEKVIAVSDSVVKYITDHYKTVHHKILSVFIEALTLLLFRITTNLQHSGLTKFLTTFPNSRINFYFAYLAVLLV